MDKDITEHEVLHALYADYHRWLKSWLYQRLGSSEQAADFVQDTFVRILLNSSQLSAIREPRAYLKTIASRLIIDNARRRHIEQAWVEAWSELNQDDAVACSAEASAEIIELLTRIASLLDGMPEKIRNAFLWSRLENVTYAEIAQRLGVSTSSVKQYIARAMLHCHDLME